VQRQGFNMKNFIIVVRKTLMSTVAGAGAGLALTGAVSFVPVVTVSTTLAVTFSTVGAVGLAFAGLYSITHSK
jgi:hypothetical protein|tara:strand:- start:5935 stop:6153 length:219 start_codon:yes stop_codon:yes gene_type:complete